MRLFLGPFSSYKLGPFLFFFVFLKNALFPNFGPQNWQKRPAAKLQHFNILQILPIFQGRGPVPRPGEAEGGRRIRLGHGYIIFRIMPFS